MSPRSEQQFEEIREERKAQIKRVALEIISEEGFEHASISRIAVRASISKGLMYNYFVSKEEMIREIILDGFNEFLIVLDPDKDGVLTHEEAHFFIDELFRILEANLKYWRLYFSVMMQPKVMSLIAEDFKKITDPLIRMIQIYFTSQGSEQPEVDTRITLALMDGICLHYIMDPRHFPLQDIKKRLYEMI